MTRTKSSLFWCVCVFLMVASWSAAALASVVIYQTDQEMTLKASRIVRAKVVKKVSQWEPKEKRIYTYITLVVLDPLKGATGAQELVIRQMGGTANGIGMHVPGSATFTIGEEVVVFLETIRQQPKFHHVMGMAMGKFKVVEDAKTKARTLVRQLKGVSLARRTPQGRFQIKHGKDVVSIKPVVLDTFVNKIKTYLREAKMKSVPVRPTPTLRATPKAPVKEPLVGPQLPKKPANK